MSAENRDVVYQIREEALNELYTENIGIFYDNLLINPPKSVESAQNYLLMYASLRVGYYFTMSLSAQEAGDFETEVDDAKNYMKWYEAIKPAAIGKEYGRVIELVLEVVDEFTQDPDTGTQKCGEILSDLIKVAQGRSV